MPMAYNSANHRNLGLHPALQVLMSDFVEDSISTPEDLDRISNF